MPESEYRRALDSLYRRRRFGMRPGLEVVTALLRELGDPQQSFRALHVTGSKGKGSVSAMAASALRGTGRRTGRFTSPHLVSFRERIEVDGAPIPTSGVVEGLRAVEDASERLERSGQVDRAPTFFEAVTVLAFDWFRRQRVEQAVVEVGIGGRLDSTNVLRSAVGVVTTVELEHVEILGPTVADIAREKAGILHRGLTGVVGTLPPAALEEVRRRARAEGVPLWELGREIHVDGRELEPAGQRFTVRTPHGAVSLLLPFLGSFQPANAALAIAAVQRFGEAEGLLLDPDTIRRGLEATRWRGRMERVARKPDLYLDAAHTPESAQAVADSFAEISPFLDPGENALLFGCLGDKPVERILDRLAPLARTLVAVTPASERSTPAAEVARRAVGLFPMCVTAGSVRDGLALARSATASGGFTLVTGSDYLVGEVLRLVEGGGEDEPDLSDPVRAPLDGKGRTSGEP